VKPGDTVNKAATTAGVEYENDTDDFTMLMSLPSITIVVNNYPTKQPAANATFNPSGVAVMLFCIRRLHQRLFILKPFRLRPG
jgi:hypothetical protein